MADQEEGEEPNQVEERSNHRAGIVSGSRRRINHLAARQGFGKGQGHSGGIFAPRSTQSGIQIVRSRTAVIDGNVIKETVQREGTTAGHGISVAASFDYVIVNNAAIDNDRWGIVASGGVGPSPEAGVAMSQYFVVQNNICRGNAGLAIEERERAGDSGTARIDPALIEASTEASADRCLGWRHAVPGATDEPPPEVAVEGDGPIVGRNRGIEPVGQSENLGCYVMSMRIVWRAGDRSRSCFVGTGEDPGVPGPTGCDR